MGFADNYLAKHHLPCTISSEPADHTGFIIVIPCFDEQDYILNSLSSLWQCERPSSAIEVIVVVNSAANDEEKIIIRNKETIAALSVWQNEHANESFRVHVIDALKLPFKHAGAGYARKIGMDEAVRRFNMLDKPGGMILSLDADTCCAPNYFTAIDKAIKQFPRCKGLNVYFEHPVSGNDYERNVYRAITLYELHLRYYTEGLRFAGYPFAFHTVGSAFGIKAAVYAQQGGMNRRKAGEDFYFLHKIFPLGNWAEINNTAVYPSPRASHRVPFGTGKAVSKMLEEKGDLYTYHPDLFCDLKAFFDSKDKLFRADRKKTEVFINGLPESIRDFLYSVDAPDAIEEINDNSGRLTSFTKRFYNWFNGFTIVKYMNFCTGKYYGKVDVKDAAKSLFELTGLAVNSDLAVDLLGVIRERQRGGRR